MNIIAVVPARSGSKGLPNKNIAIDLNALSKTLKKVESLKELIEFYADSPFKKLKDGRSST